MTKISHLIVSISTVLPAMIFLLAATSAEAADNASEPRLKVDNHSFKCITEMTPVRHFYVDNLLGNLEGTLAVAKAGTGEYPEGSVVQLIPNEVMIKHEKGFNAVTRDWEFFLIDVGKDGSKILRRGFTEVNNAFDLNCFACHAQARPEFDLICEQGHGCDPIPVTRAMSAALQRTDPRCKIQQPVSAEDAQALKDLGEVFKALKTSKETDKQ
jgi:hypothetical protein